MELRESENFIQKFINEDLENGVYTSVHTRFPPEPNGYLHIGHAKSLYINFGTAKKYGGVCDLRFDDTNPIKEDAEYVNAIIEDIKWLGHDINKIYYASDFFDIMHDCAIKLIEMGEAYVDDLTAAEITEYRGDFNTPGRPSPYRDRPVEENLDLFKRMTAGEFADGSKCLRAKIDMTSPNVYLRDPVIYRILHMSHHHVGDKWCVYPVYDFAQAISDAAHGVTFSLCTLEFEDRRPIYDWTLKTLGLWKEPPRQIEFARMNLSYTVTSKRRCLKLINDGLVSGWDDPRMATLCGMRRRGFPPEAIHSFVEKIGVSKANSVIEYSMLEGCVRDVLNETAARTMAVLDPVKVIVDNFPEGAKEDVEIPVNPTKPELGNFTVKFTRELYIEREDFMENPVPKYFRLCPEKEVRLKGAYFVKFASLEKDENGNITTIHVTYDPETKGGDAPDGRKVKGTLHWVSAEHSKDAEVRVYDRLFMVENPSDETGVKDFTEHINPDSMKILKNCKITEDVASAKVGDRFQFLRMGYFCIDPDTTGDKIVINKIVGLKDSWAKK